MVADDGLRGITSKPTISHSALDSIDLYGETIAREAIRVEAAVSGMVMV
jgi:hypothetical protein